jgi:hypothetical protein
MSWLYSPGCRFHRRVSISPGSVFGLSLIVVLLLAPSDGRAGLIVAPGWDLFASGPGTTFNGQPFTGVPLGSFDFGVAGVHTVGNADTIVQRMSSASVPGPVPPSDAAAPIAIEMVALQLVSVNPIDLGVGLGFYYITLQSARGGPATEGEMTITFDSEDGGTFDSFFDVFFDIRFGDLNGPIVFSDNLLLTSANVAWGRIPPISVVEIDGVNRFLNGVNRDDDFWPVPFIEQHAGGATHEVFPANVAAAVPEPSGFALVLCLGASVLFGSAIRRPKTAMKAEGDI